MDFIIPCRLDCVIPQCVNSWAISSAVVLLLFIASAATVSAAPTASAAAGNAQITVLYDAFGKASTMQKDWGYAAFLEYGGKRILFDTGNNPDILAQNAKAKGVDFDESGLRCDVAPTRRSHGRTDPPIEDEPHGEDLRAQGGVRGLRCRVYRAVFIVRTPLSLKNSATTTAHPQKSCDLDRLGRKPTFNWSTRI